MSTIEEARETLFCYVDGLFVESVSKELMKSADAYALAAHVDACKERADGGGECGNNWDGWYCDDAREIQELGGDA